MRRVQSPDSTCDAIWQERAFWLKKKMTTAVIGGGIAGVTASRLLAMLGDVSQLGRISLLDRGQRLGGRMSSRPIDDQFTWNYGHQGLGVFDRLPPGARRLEGEDRVAALALLGRAPEKISPTAVVAEQPMAVDALTLPDTIDVRLKCNVVDVRRTSDRRWQLTYERESATSQEIFDRLIVADYGAATSLLGDAAASLVDRIQGVQYDPMFAYMARLSSVDGCRPKATEAFSLLKYGTDPPRVWGFTSLDMTARLLREHPMESGGRVIPQTKEYRAAVAQVLDAIIEAAGGQVVKSSLCHRWGRAIPINPIESEPFVYDADLRLGVCGDMFRTDGAAPHASAVRSAEALARHVTLTDFTPSQRPAKL